MSERLKRSVTGGAGGLIGGMIGWWIATSNPHFSPLINAFIITLTALIVAGFFQLLWDDFHHNT
ncbi:MAG: hypothetical protein ACEQSA_00975 [Weeksellaceae bacterium]